MRNKLSQLYKTLLIKRSYVLMFLQSLNANGNAPLKFINVLIFEFLLNLLFSVLLFFSQRYFYDFITDYFFKTVIVNYLSIMIAKENNEQQ